MLSLPATALAVDDVTKDNEQNVPVVNTIDEDITPENREELDYKTPLGKKKIMNKFLLAMGAVAGSSILIFFGLTAYNNIRERFLRQQLSQDDVLSLESPENYGEAVKTFLDKTNWS